MKLKNFFSFGKKAPTETALPKVNVIFLGTCGVGKTRLYQGDGVPETPDKHTSSVMIRVQERDGQAILELSDSDGTSAKHSVPTMYVQRCHIVVLCYDMTSIDSFRETSGWYGYIKKHAPTAKIVVVGTKKDLAEQRQVQENEGQKWANGLNAVHFQEINAHDVSEVQQFYATLLTLGLGMQPTESASSSSSLSAAP